MLILLAVNTLSIMLVNAIANAQSKVPPCSHTLSGYVTDEHDGMPLEYAAVYIVELKIGGVSDSSGFYKVNGLCSGTYTVRVTHIGCDTVYEKLTLTQSMISNFQTEHHVEELERITISASRLNDETTTPRKQVAAYRLNETKGEVFAATLRSVTGINMLTTGATISKPVLHGMHSNRLLIINNGVRQEGQQWGTEHAPEIDAMNVGNLQVIKGASSVQYGPDAMAGVIIAGAPAMADSAGVSANVLLSGWSNGRGMASAVNLKGKLGKRFPLAWQVNGTLKKTGDMHTPHYNLKNSSTQEVNFSYALAYRMRKISTEVYYSQFNTKLGILSASHIGNVTDLLQAFNSDTPQVTGDFSYDIGKPFQDVQHELFKTKTYILTGTASKLELQYARQYNKRAEYDKHGSKTNDDLPEMQLEITTHSADMIWHHNRFSEISGMVGVSGFLQSNTIEGRLIIPNYKTTNAGVFIIEKWKHNNWLAEVGARYDFRKISIYKYDYVSAGNYVLTTPEHTFNNTSINAGLSYSDQKGWSFNLACGMAWRPPSVNELYSYGLHHGAAAIEKGDSQLQAETTYNISPELRYQNAIIELELNPYMHYITDYVYRQPESKPVITIQGAFPSFQYKQADALLYGSDLTCKLTPAFSTQLVYTASLVRAQNLESNTWIINTPSDRHALELRQNLKDGKRSKSAYVAVTVSHTNKQWRVSANEDFTPPPPSYALVELVASTTLLYKQQSVTVVTGINNLTNNSYRDYMDRFRYYANAPGRNIYIRLIFNFL
ncbi:MAG: TonB-dependent receptor [Bacteroidetes bacterium]|nr:TonB-dependent receptor [Bacteroidota bacterium]